MSKIIWKNYLIQKYNFYNNTNPRNRIDPDFPFSKSSYFLEKLKNQIKKIPLLDFTYRSLRGYPQNNIDSRLNWLETNIQQLYDVRCMLDDELSQLFFDETVLLRLLTFSKFFLPKPHFDEMILVLKKEPFFNPNFPHDYSGEQLYIYNSTIKDIPQLPSLNFIATKYTISLMNSYRQYFITRNSLTFVPKSGDVVIDCGACIGEIATIFAGCVGDKGEVHIFDPIPLHVKFCKLQASLNPNLLDVFHINTFAVGKKTFEVNRGTKIDNNKIRPGKIKIDQFKTISLDDYVSSHSITKVDYIKMDIEGAEKDAIIGAKNILKKYKPKLAISIYHKPDDFWSIPFLIKDINPNYKFMFAHHSPVEWESVIYAY